MTTTSVVMMIVAMIVVWGGLIAAILYLRSRPEVTSWREQLEAEPGLVPEPLPAHLRRR